jgi:hypothetical protein
VTKKPARAHHYLPQFFLAGFTLAGTRDESLWVIDREQDRSWQTRPINIAHKRDFYRVDLEDEDPNVVESLLSRLEDHAARVFREVSEGKLLPEGDNFQTLMGFVALQATRVPQFRRWYESQTAYLAKVTTRIALSSEPCFNRFVAEMREQGKELPSSITRESMLEFLADERRYRIEVPRELSIHNMAEMAKTLLPILADRNWSLFLATNSDDDFICTDRPVILIPTRPNPPPFLGFGMAHTEAVMPLNRQMALVGRYEGKGEVLRADRTLVGLFNQRMMDYAERFTYSARESFPVTAPGDDLGRIRP